MADEFIVFDPLPDAISDTLGDELNGRLEAVKVAGNLALRNQKDWANSANYKINDLVWYNSKHWYALAANINSAPASNNANWRALGGDGTGGGHRILDADGTPLAQRGDLQVMGSDVEVADNAGLGKTVITILRKVAVRVGAVAKGIRPALNFVAGDNVNITATDNAGTGAVDVRFDCTTLATHIYVSHEGAPSPSLYLEGDYVIDFTTPGATGYGDIYQKGGGVYTPVGNVLGPRGLPGLAGANGTTTRDGAGVPANTLGADGDTWIDTSTWNRYKRVTGTYQLQGNIAGVFAVIATQADAQAGTDNVKGMTPLRTKQAITANAPTLNDIWLYGGL